MWSGDAQALNDGGLNAQEDNISTSRTGCHCPSPLAAATQRLISVDQGAISLTFTDL